MQFNKDIISLFFGIFEEQEDEKTLNNLSQVCKSFNKIDKERRNDYMKYFVNIGLKPCYKRSENYILKKYSYIILEMNEYYRKYFSDSITFFDQFPNICFDLKKLKVSNMKELMALSLEDLLRKLYGEGKWFQEYVNELLYYRKTLKSHVTNYHIIFAYLYQSRDVDFIIKEINI